MDLIEGSETLAIINQTPGNYPKESLLYNFNLHLQGDKMCKNSHSDWPLVTASLTPQGYSNRFLNTKLNSPTNQD